MSATRQCFRAHPHEAHVWILAVTGGEPGPVPTTTHVCPGVEPEPHPFDTPYIDKLDPSPRTDPAVDQPIPSEMWDACVVPTWTRGDEMILFALEHGMSLQPWQMRVIAHHFPEEAS